MRTSRRWRKLTKRVCGCGRILHDWARRTLHHEHPQACVSCAQFVANMILLHNKRGLPCQKHAA